LKASDKNLFAQIAHLIQEIEPVQIFVGNPALLSGKAGAASDKAVIFAEQLREITDVEVLMVDERMSTVSAARNLRESGKSAKDSKESIDMAAAVGILEFGISLQKSRS
jgi:putative Holliday junction resolvase